MGVAGFTDGVQHQCKIRFSDREDSCPVMVSRVNNSPDHQRCPRQSGQSEVKPGMQVQDLGHREPQSSWPGTCGRAQMKTEDKILTTNAAPINTAKGRRPWKGFLQLFLQRPDPNIHSRRISVLASNTCSQIWGGGCVCTKVWHYIIGLLDGQDTLNKLFPVYSP